MKKKTALVVATRKFWPTNSGKDITLFYDCKGLHEKYGYDVYLYCMDTPSQTEGDKPDFITDVRFSGSIGSKEKIKNLLSHTVVGTRWPIQTSLYHSKRVEKELREYFDQIKPDVLFIDMIRLAPYINGFEKDTCKKILIMEDDLAKRYQVQLKSLSSSTNVMGMYQKNASKLMTALTQPKWMKKFVLNYEIPRVEKAEKDYISFFDYVTFISPIEKEKFNQRNSTDKGITLTMGTDMVDASAESPVITKEKDTLVFVGNLGYAPNADSILLIAEQILPKLRPEIKLLVVGNCPDSLKEKLQNYPQIKVCGRVEDLRSTVLSASALLAPIAYGTGIKTKIIEAMGMGMPVITNSVGAEAIAAQNGIEFFVTDDYQEMADIAERLLKDPVECEKVGQAAKQFIEAHHTWDKVYEAFGEMGL